MPTVYQLVPGSLIAKLWFNSVFPVQFVEEWKDIENTSNPTLQYMTSTVDGNAVFADLMVTATTLALGLILGMGFVMILIFFGKNFLSGYTNLSESSRARFERRKARYGFMGSNPEDDPDDDEDNTDYSVVDNSAPKTDTLSPRLLSVDEIQEEMEMDVPSPTGNSNNAVDGTNLIYGEDA